MNIGILKETRAGETRAAATPETVKQLRTKGLWILIEKSAGNDSRR